MAQQGNRRITTVAAWSTTLRLTRDRPQRRAHSGRGRVPAQGEHLLDQRWRRPHRSEPDPDQRVDGPGLAPAQLPVDPISRAPAARLGGAHGRQSRAAPAHRPNHQPHLQSPVERISIDGKPISTAVMWRPTRDQAVGGADRPAVAGFTRVKVAAMSKKFEVLTAMALRRCGRARRRGSGRGGGLLGPYQRSRCGRRHHPRSALITSLSRCRYRAGSPGEEGELILGPRRFAGHRRGHQASGPEGRWRCCWPNRCAPASVAQEVEIRGATATDRGQRSGAPQHRASAAGFTPTSRLLA